MDNYGDIGAAEGGPDGLFHNDTRFLSRLELTVNELQPLLLGSNVRDDNTVLTVDLTNPDIFQRRVQTSASSCRRTRCISSERSSSGGAPPISGSASATTAACPSTCGSRFGSTAISPTCSRCAASNASGAGRRATFGHGPSGRVELSGARWHDRRTALSFDPPPARLSEGEALYQCMLPPHDITRIFMSIGCDTTEGGKSHLPAR